MYSKFPRLIRTRRDNSSAPGRTADYDRLAAQKWIVSLFDSREECVHIDVKDYPLEMRLGH
jgi:hypothetical protein